MVCILGESLISFDHVVVHKGIGSEMSVKIEQIQLHNYRSCKRTSFEPHPNLSALIGVNGSGKSNLLNGIMLLDKIARTPRHYIADRNVQNVQSVCKMKVSFRVNDKSIKYEAVVSYIVNNRNQDEVSDTSERWNFADLTGDNNWIKVPMPVLAGIVQSNVSHRELRLYEMRVSRQMGYEKFSDLIASIPVEKISSPTSKLINFINGITYYSASQFTDPSNCPTYFESDHIARRPSLFRRYNRGRAEHVQFMYDLYLTYKDHRKKFMEYMSIVGKEGIGLMDNIKYKEVKTPSREYEVYTGGKFVKKEATNFLIIPTFIVRKTSLSPNQLSEGTFKTLAILFYLITDQSRLLLLEEPEVCIHHGLLASTLRLIKDYSIEKQIVISTHSDFVLDGLEPNNVFVVKYQSEKGTTVKHVPRTMSARDFAALREYLSNHGNLGEYWRHGDLER